MGKPTGMGMRMDTQMAMVISVVVVVDKLFG